jgi:hypothetical protein
MESLSPGNPCSIRYENLVQNPAGLLLYPVRQYCPDYGKREMGSFFYRIGTALKIKLGEENESQFEHSLAWIKQLLVVFPQYKFAYT